MSRGKPGRRRWQVVLLLAAAVLLPAVSACDNAPTPTPTGTVAPTTPTTPTTVGTLPPPSTPPTHEPATRTTASAEAFARYFWALYNYSYATTDSQALRAMSDPNCDFCKSTITDVNALQSSGSRAEGGLVTVRVAAAAPGKVRDFVVVTTVIRQGSARVLDREGTVTSTSPANPTVIFQLRIDWVSNGWRLGAVVRRKNA